MDNKVNQIDFNNFLDDVMEVITKHMEQLEPGDMIYGLIYIVAKISSVTCQDPGLANFELVRILLKMIQELDDLKNKESE